MVLVKPFLPQLTRKKFVQKPSDFGLVGSGGVITLLDNTAYEVLGEVDLLGNRIVLGENTTIHGVNANSSILKSTGLSSATALLTGTKGCKFFDLGFDGNLVFALSGDNTTGLDWRDLNFTDCEVGVIEDYNNFLGATFGFTDSYGLVFDGDIGTIGFTDTLFSPPAGETMLEIPATADISRRLRIDKCAFIVPSTATGIDISESSFTSNETFILETVNFAGAGTYISGIDETSNRALFRFCVGITNSANIGSYYMDSNATATTITTQGVYVKIAGSTTEGDFVAKFDCSTTDNRAVYEGPTDGQYKLTAVMNLTGAANKEYGVKAAKNGTVVGVAGKANTGSSGRVESLTVQDIGALTNGDYLELFIAGLDTTINPTVVDMNIAIERLN
jgi:hypothetical protein